MTGSVRERFAEPKDEVNYLALILMEEWERIEGPVTSSYVSTFADMARALIMAGPYKPNHDMVVVGYSGGSFIRQCKCGRGWPCPLLTPNKEAELRNELVHLRHCNHGEWKGECKYGPEEDCPALTEWAWLPAAYAAATEAES